MKSIRSIETLETRTLLSTAVDCETTLGYILSYIPTVECMGELNDHSVLETKIAELKASQRTLMESKTKMKHASDLKFAAQQEEIEFLKAELEASQDDLAAFEEDFHASADTHSQLLSDYTAVAEQLSTVTQCVDTFQLCLKGPQELIEEIAPAVPEIIQAPKVEADNLKCNASTPIISEIQYRPSEFADFLAEHDETPSEEVREQWDDVVEEINQLGEEEVIIVADSDELEL